MNITAGKQVGPVYYMVKDVEVLKAIVSQGVIRTSIKAEPQSRGGRKYHYVSFMRDLTKADRNPNRWVYGIQIDGTKLSDRYKINPYSFAGQAVRGNFYRVKVLAAYDDGTYALTLVNWPTMSIPESVFNDIESQIISDSQGLNNIKKLEESTGKRSYRGKTIVKKYTYNVPTGGIVLNENTVSAETLNYLLKHTNLNETEERIWILNDSVKFINIEDCITGYIEPEGDDSVEQAIDGGSLPGLRVLHY